MGIILHPHSHTRTECESLYTHTPLVRLACTSLANHSTNTRSHMRIVLHTHARTQAHSRTHARSHAHSTRTGGGTGGGGGSGWCLTAVREHSLAFLTTGQIWASVEIECLTIGRTMLGSGRAPWVDGSQMLTAGRGVRVGGGCQSALTMDSTTDLTIDLTID